MIQPGPWPSSRGRGLFLRPPSKRPQPPPRHPHKFTVCKRLASHTDVVGGRPSDTTLLKPTPAAPTVGVIFYFSLWRSRDRIGLP